MPLTKLQKDRISEDEEVRVETRHRLRLGKEGICNSCGHGSVFGVWHPWIWGTLLLAVLGCIVVLGYHDRWCQAAQHFDRGAVKGANQDAPRTPLWDQSNKP